MDVDKFMERAEAALRKRAPDQAITLYRQVLTAKPGNGPARRGLMAAYRKRADLKGGASMIDRATARSLHAAAMGLRSSKRWSVLVKTCDAALEKSPHDGALVAMLAEGLEAQGLKDEALAAWESRLDADAQDLLALKHAGRLNYELRHIDIAIQQLERAHAIDRHDPEVERLRKNLAAEGTLASTRYESAQSSRDVIKDRDALRRTNEEARGGAPGIASAGTPAGHVAGDDLAGLRAAFLKQPSSVDLRRRLLRAYSAAGRRDDALSAVDDALAAVPQDEGLLDARGDLAIEGAEAALAEAESAGDETAIERLKAERLRVEIEECARRSARHPSDASLRLRLARAHYKAGQTDKALENFQAAVADPRYELESRQGLGACFYRKGLFPLAARQFESALAAAGGVASEKGKEICYHLGLVSERMNDRSGALTRYLQIYEVDINYKDVSRKIEDLKPSD
jgi:tetratricopeptide (TPR) repeat protein